jgi:hypothetical protein
VDRWYRWSTFSSHIWEDTHWQDIPLDQGGGECGWSSSIEGNRPYFFRSRAAGSIEAINYAFFLWDGDTTRNSINSTFSDIWVPGRYYFRQGIPSDSDGKTGVIIHTGRTVDHLNPAANYNGSAGCIVSPQFYALRNRMIALYQRDYQLAHGGTSDPDLVPLENRDRAASEGIFAEGHGSYSNQAWEWLGRVYEDESWESKFQGQAYVIRPDEAVGR